MIRFARVDDPDERHERQRGDGHAPIPQANPLPGRRLAYGRRAPRARGPWPKTADDVEIDVAPSGRAISLTHRALKPFFPPGRAGLPSTILVTLRSLASSSKLLGDALARTRHGLGTEFARRGAGLFGLTPARSTRRGNRSSAGVSNVHGDPIAAQPRREPRRFARSIRGPSSGPRADPDEQPLAHRPHALDLVGGFAEGLHLHVYAPPRNVAQRQLAQGYEVPRAEEGVCGAPLGNFAAIRPYPRRRPLEGGRRAGGPRVSISSARRRKVSGTVSPDHPPGDLGQPRR